MSKAAVWRAMNSEEHSDRLEQIMYEHIAIAKKLSDNLNGYRNTPEAQVMMQRIADLRVERDAIIKLFEEMEETTV